MKVNRTAAALTGLGGIVLSSWLSGQAYRKIVNSPTILPQVQKAEAEPVQTSRSAPVYSHYDGANFYFRDDNPHGMKAFVAYSVEKCGSFDCYDGYRRIRLTPSDFYWNMASFEFPRELVGRELQRISIYAEDRDGNISETKELITLDGKFVRKADQER